MPKQKTAHQVLKGLIDAGYTYRQLHAHYGLSISTMHNMVDNEAYNESAATRDLLNGKKPTEKPRWGKRK